MASSTSGTDRVASILSRQIPPRWGAAYVPAIQVTRQEAPRISRPSLLNSRRLGRAVHVLSTPERIAAQLALYHPGLRDLHEQKMLSVVPAAHPLATFPGLVSTGLPSSSGTVAIAEALGHLDMHAMVPTSDGWAPSPYVGDLFLILEDGDGVFCVNWTVKKSAKDFTGRPGNLRRSLREKTKENQRANFRHTLERLYYEELGIRTVQVTADAVPHHLACNLSGLFAWDRRALSLTNEQRLWVVEEARHCIATGEPVSTQINRLTAEAGCQAQDVLGAIYQAIWRRELRVDLYRPVLVNHPLAPEQRDVIAHYAEWFGR